MNKEQLRKINLLQSNLCFIPELLNYIAFYAENNKDANKHDLACMIYALSDLLEPALHERCAAAVVAAATRRIPGPGVVGLGEVGDPGAAGRGATGRQAAAAAPIPPPASRAQPCWPRGC